MSIADKSITDLTSHGHRSAFTVISAEFFDYHLIILLQTWSCFSFALAHARHRLVYTVNFDMRDLDERDAKAKCRPDYIVSLAMTVDRCQSFLHLHPDCKATEQRGVF